MIQEAGVCDRQDFGSDHEHPVRIDPQDGSGAPNSERHVRRGVCAEGSLRDSVLHMARTSCVSALKTRHERQDFCGFCWSEN